MTALSFTVESHHQLKRTLRSTYPAYGSAHVSEALASALGFGSNAALLEHLRNVERDGFPEFILLDGNAFRRRLGELGYASASEIRPEVFATLNVEGDGAALVDTTPASAFDIQYRSQRARAWRNAMVAAINAGLEQRLFSLRPGD